ncbi:MAG: 50S ribosomal protein L3 [archaeon]
MPPTRPRWGSLQFWPRKRAAKFLPSANWKPVKGQGLLGLIAYKAGMATVIVKDNTEASMTKGKKMALPVTILEVPGMKIFSVRFYKNTKVLKDVIVANDKELKHIVKVPASLKPFDSQIPADYDDIRLVVFTLANKTAFKKTPDILEVAVSAPNKLDYVKTLIGKEITMKDFLDKKELLDVHAVSKGKGLEGPVPRMGLSLKGHKSEKGVRRPGSLGPWHPARVTFRTPMSGQLGWFTRVVYNLNLITSGTIAEKNINPGTGFKHYGNIKTSYMIIHGSIPGPVKRAVLVVPAIRPTKLQSKQKYQFTELAI